MTLHRIINDHKKLKPLEGVIYCLIRFHKVTPEWISEHIDQPLEVVNFYLSEIKKTFLGKYIRKSNGVYKLSPVIQDICLDDAVKLFKVKIEKETKNVRDNNMVSNQ